MPTFAPLIGQPLLRRQLTACLLAAGLIGGLMPRTAQAGPLAWLSRTTLPESPSFSIRPTSTDEADEEVTDRLIIKYRSGTAGARKSVLSAAAQTHAEVYRQGRQVLSTQRNAQGAQVLRLDKALPASEMRALARQVTAADTTVLYAEPDYKVRRLATPNDPLYTQQWHYFHPTAGLNLPTAWDLARGIDVVVAVVDTGVRPHEDLNDGLLSGYDFITDTTMANDGDGRDADATDPGDGCNGARSSWHGTHVAGTVAARGDNNLGVIGVAPGAQILPVRVLGCGGGYNSDIADGIIWASGGSVSGLPSNPNPAKVINLSLGGRSPCSTTVQTAIDTARANGAVVVVAAGNSNTLVGNFSPANCKGVVTVAATGSTGGRAPYSNYGTAVDVAAPGGHMAKGTTWGVLSTLNDGSSTPGNDSYQFYQGTSMATPHVAGVAALMLSRNPSLTPDEVETLLKGNTRAFPAVCSQCGTGIVHAERAVRSVFVGTAQAADLSETESNDALLAGQAIASLPVRVAGQLSTNTDVDHYRVDLAPGATLVARLIASPNSNMTLALRNPMGVVKVSSAKAAGLPDTVTWRNPMAVTGSFYLRVVRVSGTMGSPGGNYTLEMALQ